MNREARRLVDNNERVVLVQHSGPEGRGNRGRWLCSSLGQSQWRDPDYVPGRQAGVRTDPPSVQPHLAAAKDPIYVAFRHALQDAQQEVVDPLASRIFSDRKRRASILA
jgi:hypothetical protein